MDYYINCNKMFKSSDKTQIYVFKSSKPIVMNLLSSVHKIKLIKNYSFEFFCGM